MASKMSDEVHNGSRLELKIELLPLTQPIPSSATLPCRLPPFQTTTQSPSRQLAPILQSCLDGLGRSLCCEGKTTAYLRERGLEVFTAPESFTILASNGLSLDYFATEGMDIVTQLTD